MSAAYPWDADWHGIDDPEQARGLERELARELPRDHILAGRTVTALSLIHI